MRKTTDSQTRQVKLTWQERLSVDFPEVNSEARQGILRWLLKERTATEFDSSIAGEAAGLERQRERRYRVLKQRYWQVNALESYYKLVSRLGSLAARHPQIRRQLASAPSQQQAFVLLVQEVLQQLVSQDTYLQQQLTWIAQCTPEKGLRQQLFFASLEEYCFHCPGRRPQFLQHLVGFLQRQ